MKKVLSIAIFILFILLFSSGCTKKPRIDISKIPNSYYENIESISYTTISFMGDGGTETKTIDFNENKVIIVQRPIGTKPHCIVTKWWGCSVIGRCAWRSCHWIQWKYT